MIKALVLYDSRYGNTRLAAEAIIEGMCLMEGTRAVLSDVRKLQFDHIDWYDLIVVGSPNHLGGPTRSIKKLMDRLEKLDLDEKKGAFFDTCFSKDHQKAVGKMEQRLKEKVPCIKLLVPGLSVRVERMKGPLAEGELEKCHVFGKEIIMRMNGRGSL